jgi:hypothetical protein
LNYQAPGLGWQLFKACRTSATAFHPKEKCLPHVCNSLSPVEKSLPHACNGFPQVEKACCRPVPGFLALLVRL